MNDITELHRIRTAVPVSYITGYCSPQVCKPVWERYEHLVSKAHVKHSMQLTCLVFILWKKFLF